MATSGSGFDVPIRLNEASQMQDISDRAALHMLQRKQLADMYSNMAATPLPDKPTDATDPNFADNMKAYQAALAARAKGLEGAQKVYTPEHHASFAQHLHGLIFGSHKVDPATGQIAPDGQTAPVQAGPVSANAPTTPNGVAAVQSVAPSGSSPVPIVAAAQPAPAPESNAPVEPIHPLATAPADHPIHGITKGIKALGDHLKAFAHPLPPEAGPDYQSLAAAPTSEERKNAEQEKIWGIRGQNALDLQEKKNEYLKAMLAARPPRFLSQTTVPDLLEQMKVDPTMTIFAPDGHEMSPAQLSEMPAGTIARQFKSGMLTFYALGDQNSKTLNVNGQIYDIPAVGPINIAGPKQNSSVVGQATSTLPKQATDAFGTTTTTKTIVPPVSSAAPAPPSSTPPEPVLQTRPNPGARTPGTQPQGGAVKGPVSAAVPSMPSAVPPLDADGHIPAGYGNDLARQYANNLLDGMAAKDIPNPRARAAAEKMAGQFGWSQGTFTPKEKVQFQVATNFLEQLQKSPALSVLDNFVSREKIARAMKAPKDMSIIDRAVAYNLTPQESEFIKLFNAAAGTVQGLSSITRAGRATDSTVNRLQQELPNVFQSASSKDAKGRIGQLLKEANDALQTNPMKVGRGGPVSKNAPQVGSWKPPADAPAAPKEDGKVLKADGKVIAISQGGNWTDPNAH